MELLATLSRYVVVGYGMFTWNPSRWRVRKWWWPRWWFWWRAVNKPQQQHKQREQPPKLSRALGLGVPGWISDIVVTRFFSLAARWGPVSCARSRTGHLRGRAQVRCYQRVISLYTHTHWIDTVRVIVSLTLSSSPLTRKKNGRLKIPAENRQRVSPLKILDLIKMYKKRIGWHVKNQAPSTLSPDSMASPADAKIMWRNQAPQSQDKTSRRSVTSPSVECLNLDWLLAVVVVVRRRRRRRRRQWVKRATGRYGSRGSDRVYSFIRSPWPRTPFSESRLLSSRACKLPFQLNRSYSCSHGEKIKKTTSFLSVSQL